jgi:hypothetical protein
MDITAELTEIDWKKIWLMPLLIDAEKRKPLDKVTEVFN